MKNKCCICGAEFKGYGNNAQPLGKGTCCDVCNWAVIKARYNNRKKKL